LLNMQTHKRKTGSRIAMAYPHRENGYDVTTTRSRMV